MYFDEFCRSGKKRKKKMLMSLAVKILEKWYERNCLHPYPTPEAAAVLAEAGNLTVEQVCSMGFWDIYIVTLLKNRNGCSMVYF